MLTKLLLFFVFQLTINCFLHSEDLFESKVVSILESKCLSCHNPDDKKGDLDLSTHETAFQNKEVIVLGSPEKSELIYAISGDKPEMPPKGPSLSNEEREILRQWILKGAKWPKNITLKDNPSKDLNWWSLKPIQQHLPPKNDRHPIDAFIQETLSEKGLVSTEEASPETLLRRVTYDLTGLPPTPEELRNFIVDYKNDSEVTWSNTLDRLLNSKTYGEKFGRHWLDLARFAETHGYDKDKLRHHAWPYRDYVINSFNEDLPYTQFVKDQIAGDRYAERGEVGIKALGFLAAGPWDHIGHTEVGEAKFDGRIAKHIDRDEMVSSVFNVFMSTTIQCAQCHHHKFDPIRMEDYYRMHSVFSAIDRADRAYNFTEQEEIDYNQLQDKINSIKHKIRTIKKDIENEQKENEKNTEIQETEKLLQLNSDLKKQEVALNKENRKLKKFKEPKYVYAAATSFKRYSNLIPRYGKARPIHLLHRGDLKSPKKLMTPGAPALWKGAKEKFFEQPEWNEGEARKKLAEYLVTEENPIVWRSISNRIWQWCFGRGIASSPNDLGRMGRLPTHPELLEHISYKFKNDPQHSIKSLVKWIMSSKTYRKSSRELDENLNIDSENNYLWRFNRRRLTAEEYRDSLLVISGKLNLKMYGDSFKDFVIEHPAHSPHFRYDLHDPNKASTHRRSIYRFTVRSQPHPFLTTLDCADPSSSIAVRDESTTALQALSQWNNKFVEAMTVHFSNRIKSELEKSSQDAITMICQYALGRDPDDQERHVLNEYLKEHGMENLSRIIFNMSAYNYVD